MAFRRLTWRALRPAVAAATALLAFVASPVAAQGCNRACMTAAITGYIDALVAHDASRLPLKTGVRYTEDSRDAKLGEGIWTSVTAKGSFRHDYLDTRRQVAASHFVVMEDKVPVLYSLLLHMDGRQIGGIETLVSRILPESRFQPTELGRPIRGLDDPVPSGKAASRADLIRIALSYTEGLRVGNFTDARTPFAADTYRVENGVIMAGEGCSLGDCGMYTQKIMVHPGMIASVAAVDEEAGVALLWMNFGFTNSYGEGNALVTFEAFKIWDGKIQAVNAFFRTLPISTPRFWPSADPLP